MENENETSKDEDEEKKKKDPQATAEHVADTIVDNQEENEKEKEEKEKEKSQNGNKEKEETAARNEEESPSDKSDKKKDGAADILSVSVSDSVRVQRGLEALKEGHLERAKKELTPVANVSFWGRSVCKVVEQSTIIGTQRYVFVAIPNSGIAAIRVAFF